MIQNCLHSMERHHIRKRVLSLKSVMETLRKEKSEAQPHGFLIVTEIRDVVYQL